MKLFKILSVLFPALLLSCQPGTEQTVINFDDLSSLIAESPPYQTTRLVKNGDKFKTADIITEKKSGVKIVILGYRWPDNTAPGHNQKWTQDGFIEIVRQNKAGGKRNEIHFDNACLGVILPNPPKIEKITVKFTVYGGNINLMEEGKVHYDENFADIASPTARGLIINVAATGTGTEVLELTGNLKAFNFPGPLPQALDNKNFKFDLVFGGGQEIWADDLIFFLQQ